MFDELRSCLPWCSISGNPKVDVVRRSKPAKLLDTSRYISVSDIPVAIYQSLYTNSSASVVVHAHAGDIALNVGAGD